MSRITDPDGPVAQALTKIANLALINIYFLICSIPVFTIGAAFTAMMDIAWNMTKGTEGTGITKAYFHSFKSNFKRSTGIWLIQLVLIFVLFVDFRAGQAIGIKGNTAVIFYAIFGLLCMLVAFTTWYALTMQAIFDNTVINMIKNGLLISLAKFPYSLGIAVCFLSPFIVFLMSPQTAFFFLPLMVLLWFGCVSYGAAFLFRKALAPFLPEGYGEETGRFTDDEEMADMQEALSRFDEIPGNKEEERWDIYDKDKKLTGRTMKRNDWNMADGDYHLSVLGVIKTPEDKYLITKRVATKEWAPGAYEVSGGGVRASETSEEAVRREVREETGLDVNNAVSGGYVFTYRRDNPEEKNNYFMDVYEYMMDISDEDIHLQTEETDGFRFASAEEIKELADQGQFLHYESIKQVFKK